MGIEQKRQSRAQRSLIEFGRAVGDPTRAAMLDALHGSDGLTVAELTERFRLHHSAIRSHLRVLAASGRVSPSTAISGGRGRPAKRFHVVPGAVERWGRTGPHRELASMLIDVVTGGSDVLESGRKAGRRLVAGLPSSEPMRRVSAVTARLGFEPETPQAAGPDITIRLRACPFADEAAAAREVVCGLHQGVLEGALADTPVRLRELTVADPHVGGCQLRLWDDRTSA